MPKRMSDNSPYLVPALQRGLQILELFSQSRRVLTLNDFADALGVSTSSIYRTVVTLTEMQYLKKLERTSYELGARVVSNGFCYLASREIVQIAAPHLLDLRDTTSSACHLAIRDGIDAIYLYRAPSPQRLAVNVQIGTRLPCHATAIGRALLSGLDQPALTDLFAGIALDAISAAGPSSLPQLRQVLEEEKRQGFHLNRSDFSTAIAAPVRNFAGQIVAAINVSAPDTLMGDLALRQNLATMLLTTAAAISAEVGGQ